MMKFLIIQLCDSSISFCHYSAGKTPKLISLDNLRHGILWAIKRGLYLQVLYPDYDLPKEYNNLLNQNPHVKIASYRNQQSDVLVFNDWESFDSFEDFTENPIIIRTTVSDFLENHFMLRERLNRFNRVNIVFTDVDAFEDSDISEYENALSNLSEGILKSHRNGNDVQLNLLTDRLMLTEMNNCNAGIESIMLAPDGNFYVCPAFYHEHDSDIGNPFAGVNILNQHLLKSDHAPICRNCDSYHCKRCIWLNKKTTFEVNTPRRQQCVMSHIERKVSKKLLEKICEIGNVAHYVQILDINYIDPFEKLTRTYI